MTETKENIFLFVPNIIGFGRVILAIIAFYFMPTHCVLACTCYITSALLDAFDGHAARYFNQSTKFGAMLDQLTDRAGTAGLMMTLATFYPKYTFWLQLSMAIDITCHWLYLHTSTLQGKTSHKFIDMSENPIMHLYYTNKNVLFFMCAGNEAFYAALYVMYFYSGPTVMGMGLFKLIALLSMPIAVVKAAISVLHGIVASVNLSIIDVNERAALAQKQNKGHCLFVVCKYGLSQKIIVIDTRGVVMSNKECMPVDKEQYLCTPPQRQSSAYASRTVVVKQ